MRQTTRIHINEMIKTSLPNHNLIDIAIEPMLPEIVVCAIIKVVL
ncbi:hypothetical protein [Undibacterium flavidum]|nr:hypothetical protein [Undibacterium flavidum]